MQRVRLAGWLGLFLALSAPARAQYNTPTLDGVISAGEYGTQTDGQNQQTTNNGNTTWYMTYDADYLYIGITGINGGDASFTYLDVNPAVPVNGGSDSNGNTFGIGYDNHNFSKLPFRADYALYANRGGQQLLQATGSGGWSFLGGSSVISSYIVDGVRELRIAWATLGGRPASYNWLGYASYQNNGTAYLFGAVPTGNPGPVNYNTGNSQTLVATFYYAASVVGSGGTKPFSRNSYTFPGTGSLGSFGAFTVYDFTLNTPGQQLSRGCGGGDWVINGTLTVGGGELYFGSANGGNSACGGYGATTVGNVRVVGGLLDMDYSFKPLTVSGDVSVSGGTLKLSNTGGGDLRLAGNLSLTGGTFNPTTRALLATGTAQTLTGSTATPLALPYLFVQQAAAGSTVTLGSDAAVGTELGFGTGGLLTNGYVLDLGTAGIITSETPASNLTGFARATRPVGAGGSGAVNFGNLGLTLTPTGSSAALGSVSVTRSRGLGMLRDKNNNKSISRNFRVVPATSAGPFEVTLTLGYFDAERGTIAQNNLELFSSTNAQTYPTSGVGSFQELGVSSRDDFANTLTRSGLTDFGGGSATGIVFTLGDVTAPLPVVLVSFQGRRAGAGVQLSWRTGLEVDNAGFGIERQAAGGEWQAVATVPGTGSSQGQAYEYRDAAAPAGQLYYRLRQQDHDGRVSYSPVVAVAAAGSAELALALSPVPAPADQPALTVDLSALPAAGRTLTVYDLQGRVVGQATAAATDAQATLPLARLAAGTYVVLVQSGGRTYRSRFSKL